MTKELPPLREEALETLAQIIGDRYTGGQITNLFQRSGFPDIAHDGGTKWRFVAAAFSEMQRQAGGGPYSVLKVIETMCHPQGYIGNHDLFKTTLDSVNAVLAFYALKISEQGTLLWTGQATSTIKPSKSVDEVAFDARNFHVQVARHGRSHFCRGAYFHAVFECCKAFDSAVRQNGGIDKSGQALMSEAMSLGGAIKLNAQRTQSEKDEQQGVMFLCMGLMNAVRNPQAHEPELNWPMTREDALDVLGLISFLFRKLENAVVYVPGQNTARVRL